MIGVAKKFVFFINPLARDGKLGRQWQEVEHHFKSQLQATEFLMPTSVEQCREQVAEAAREDDVCVVAVGGEGSMNVVANSILNVHRETCVPMGLVPFGNVNDYAMNIGMSKDWEHALETLKSCHVMPVGVVELVTRKGSFYSLNVADVGFSAATAKQHTIDHQLAWLKGRLKYNILALKMMIKWHNIPSRIVIDDEVIEGELALVLTGFSPTLAGFRVLPHAHPENEKMAVTIGINTTKMEMVRLMEQAKKGAINESEHILFRLAQKLVVEAETPLVAEVDGEIVDTDAYKVEFIAHPGRLQFVVPASLT